MKCRIGIRGGHIDMESLYRFKKFELITHLIKFSRDVSTTHFAIFVSQICVHKFALSYTFPLSRVIKLF
jgi:hypothetical protein